MEFRRRKGFQIKTNPQIVGEFCYELEKKKGGKITPKELVDAARDVNSPLHNEFEWNDSVAAEKYRRTQARYIINSIEVKITTVPAEITHIDLEIKETECVKFYHALDKDGSGYENLYAIDKDEEKRNKLLDNCLKDLLIFKEKYEVLRMQLQHLFECIDETLGG